MQNRQKLKSDGGSSSYYDIPEGCTTLNDLIEYKNMTPAESNIFKAIYRMGLKEGTDVEYDLRKIEYYVGRLRGIMKKYGDLRVRPD